MEKFKQNVNNIWKAINRFIVTNVIRIYSKIVYRYEVIGKENIPNTSYFDGPLIIISSPRLMRFMAKQELKGNLLFRYLCYAYDAIYVKRDSKDIGPLKEALKELKDGGSIGIFPEGTRNGLDKNDGKMKNGAAYMALKTGAKIIPIGINGEAKPFHKVSITYGKPIDFTNLLEGKTAKDVEEEATEILKNEIVKLIK